MMSLFATTMLAQAPQKMSYQAVIRNSSNLLVANTNVGIKISILQTAPNGTVVYSETHTPTTNANGLATLEIGGGTLLSGNFATINWANGPFYIKTETDPAGGISYSIISTSQLLSVPFALYAANAGNSPKSWEVSGTNIYNNNSGNVGIGFAVPTEKLSVNGKTKTTNLQVTTDAGVGKILTSDATGNASWTTPIAPVINNFTKQSFGISTSTQGSVVDIPLSNFTATTSGYYLITYFSNASNNWYLSCTEPCTGPKVVETRVYLYNKTSGAILQNQKIDFLNRKNTSAANALVNTFSYELPSHEVSGSFAYYLNVGDIIGLRVGSQVSAVGVVGTIVGSGEITVIRLY